MSKAHEYLASWLRWRSGRQGTGYDKFLILASPFPVAFDLYLLRYPIGAEIATHRDPVESGRHYLLNIVVKTAGTGGEFLCENPIYVANRIKLFRPDLSAHGVTRVGGSPSYVLSLGWVLK